MDKKNNSPISKTTRSIALDELEARELRQIKSSHKFPCYGCFDQLQQRHECKVCNSKGYIAGDHPMVRFADDFLTQNLAKLLQAST